MPTFNRKTRRTFESLRRRRKFALAAEAIGLPFLLALSLGFFPEINA